MAKTAKSFEEAVSRLEEIVHMLENGGASLEESLKLYEEGIVLVRTCNQKLDATEKKIKLLTEMPNGDIEEKDLDDDHE